MEFHAQLAAMAMTAESSTNDFMTKANIPLPGVRVPGSFPVMVRSLNPATEIHEPMDLLVLWGIGDFGPSYPCSSYYDPSSPWYNVFYGAYAIASYKRDGAPFGYDSQCRFNVDEFLRLPELDYNFLTAGQFGCPPSKMSFEPVPGTVSCQKKGVWDFVDLKAWIPSGLHAPTPEYHAKVGTYIVFGVPEASFMAGRDSYEKVLMHGQFHVRHLMMPPGQQPITVAWGSACRDTPEGNKLLAAIIDNLTKDYFHCYDAYRGSSA